jgi:hypothetical protein
MGSCTTKIQLSEDDKKVLELSIDDKMNFTSNLLLCNSKTALKSDKLYLNKLAFQHLERQHLKK